jgi:hypothetical protein
MEGGRNKGEWWRRWIQLWYTVRTFVNVTMFLQYDNNMIIKKFWKKTLDYSVSTILRYHADWSGGTLHVGH